LAGVAGVLAFVALWFRTHSDPDQSGVVYARTPAAQAEASVVASTRSPEPAPVVAAQVKPAVAVAEESPAAPPVRSEAVSKPTASSPAHEAVVANPPKATTSTVQGSAGANVQGLAGTRPSEVAVAAVNLPPPSVVPEKKAQPDFRINGIIYTSRPSAIVNGQMVVVGDQVGDATVLAIAQTSVTLQVKGERKTYELK